MVERLVSFYDGLFSGAMLVSGGKSFALPPFFVRKKRYNEFSSPKFSYAKNFASERLGERMNMHENSLVDQIQAFRWSPRLGVDRVGPQKSLGMLRPRFSTWWVVGRFSPTCIQMEVRKHPQFFMDYDLLRRCLDLDLFWKDGITMEHTINNHSKR